MWIVLVIEEFVVLCMVFYYFIAYRFSTTHSSLTSYSTVLQNLGVAPRLKR